MRFKLVSYNAWIQFQVNLYMVVTVVFYFILNCTETSKGYNKISNVMLVIPMQHMCYTTGNWFRAIFHYYPPMLLTLCSATPEGDQGCFCNIIKSTYCPSPDTFWHEKSIYCEVSSLAKKKQQRKPYSEPNSSLVHPRPTPDTTVTEKSALIGNNAYMSM